MNKKLYIKNTSNFLKKRKKNKQLRKILLQYFKLSINKKQFKREFFDMFLYISFYRKNTFLNCFDRYGTLLVSTSEGLVKIKRKERNSKYSGSVLVTKFIEKITKKCGYQFSNLIIFVKDYNRATRDILMKLHSSFLIKKIIIKPKYAFNGSRKPKQRRK